MHKSGSHGESNLGQTPRASISADGRYVTFSSYASNLVEGDTNNRSDVFRVPNPFFGTSLSATLSNGNLTITDFAGKNNVLTVRSDGTNLFVVDEKENFLAVPSGGKLLFGNTLSIPANLITGSVIIDTGNGDDQVTLSTLASTQPFTATGKLAVNLGTGIDSLSLRGSQTANVWNITGQQSGTIAMGNLNSVTFQGLERAVGGDNSDLFRISNTGANGILSLNGNKRTGIIDALEVTRNADFTLSNSKLVIAGAIPQTFSLAGIQRATLSGGPGNNFIDAKTFSGTAILNGNDGNDVLWGGSGDDTLNGGSGDDWLSGGAGNDTLLGYNGRDILVGGTGADKLNLISGVTGAGYGSDLLIGGKTSYDNDKAAIDAILAAWANAQSYFLHISQLTSGVGPSKQYKLNFSTVHDDNASDILLGGTGNDWFFAGTSGTNKDTYDHSGFEQVENF